ncbi:MAG: hypothetical protein ACRDTE_27625 [Pseudonocardiaceae bacterium]
MAVAFGTLPAVVVVGRLMDWWAGCSPAAVLLRSHLRGWRAHARRVLCCSAQLVSGRGGACL